MRERMGKREGGGGYLDPQLLEGGGSSRPLICVMIGPSTPGTMMVSPSLRVPLIRITSMVVPIPGRAFTWSRKRMLVDRHVRVNPNRHVIGPSTPC